PPSGGSRLDADHPANGVPIPRRSTRRGCLEHAALGTEAARRILCGFRRKPPTVLTIAPTRAVGRASGNGLSHGSAMTWLQVPPPQSMGEAGSAFSISDPVHRALVVTGTSCRLCPIAVSPR